MLQIGQIHTGLHWIHITYRHKSVESSILNLKNNDFETHEGKLTPSFLIFIFPSNCRVQCHTQQFYSTMPRGSHLALVSNTCNDQWQLSPLNLHPVMYTWRTQSMKIDHRKTNQSIETNRCQLVNWYQFVSVNRLSIDSHIKLSANYMDFHLLAILIGYWLLFDENRWKVTESCFIDCLLISNINQLINCYRLISIGIDFDRLTNSSIACILALVCISGQVKH